MKKDDLGKQVESSRPLNYMVYTYKKIYINLSTFQAKVLRQELETGICIRISISSCMLLQSITHQRCLLCLTQHDFIPQWESSRTEKTRSAVKTIS